MKHKILRIITKSYDILYKSIKKKKKKRLKQIENAFLLRIDN